MSTPRRVLPTSSAFTSPPRWHHHAPCDITMGPLCTHGRSERCSEPAGLVRACRMPVRLAQGCRRSAVYVLVADIPVPGGHLCLCADAKAAGWAPVLMRRALCSAVLCCVVLCYAMLCCVVLCCAMLCCAMMCCAMLCCVFCSVLPVPSAAQGPRPGMMCTARHDVTRPGMEACTARPPHPAVPLCQPLMPALCQACVPQRSRARARSHPSSVLQKGALQMPQTQQTPTTPCSMLPTLLRLPRCCYVWGAAQGGHGHAFLHFCIYLQYY